MEKGLQENCRWNPPGPEANIKKLANQNGFPEILLLGAKPGNNAVRLFIPLRFLDGCPRPGALVDNGNCDQQGAAWPWEDVRRERAGQSKCFISTVPRWGVPALLELVNSGALGLLGHIHTYK